MYWQSFMKSKLWSIVLYVVFVMPLLLLVVTRGRFALLHPALNWDVLPYVGLVERLRHNNDIELHAKAYADVYSYAKLHANLLMGAWSPLIAVGRYRIDNFNNPAVFAAQLPFYSCKPLYIWALSCVSFFTSTITAAAVYLSVISGFITAGLIVAFSYFKKIPLSLSLIIGSLFFISPIALSNIQIQTPDAFGVMFVALATILFMAKYEKLAAFVFLLSVLIRPDLEVLCFILAVILFLANVFLNKKFSKIAILLLFASVILKTLVYQYYRAYGYSTLFDFQFFTGATDFPNQSDVGALSFARFLDVVRSSITFDAIYSSSIIYIAFFLAGLGIYFNIKREAIRFDISVALYLSTTLYFVAHIVLFPLLELRYFEPILMVGFLVLIDQVRVPHQRS